MQKYQIAALKPLGACQMCATNPAQVLAQIAVGAQELPPTSASAVLSGVTALLAHEAAPLSSSGRSAPDVRNGILAPLNPAWVDAPRGDPARKVPCCVLALPPLLLPRQRHTPGHHLTRHWPSAKTVPPLPSPIGVCLSVHL